MPGIVGIITRRPRQHAEGELLSMIRALSHESFYETGNWSDEKQGIYVGWVARKGSFSAGMPLRSEAGDRTLIFAGEEYPDPAVIADLKRRGHVVKAPGPDYLIHLAEEDREFPKSLNGRFHGILVDARDASATLFNDRYGMQRLYVHESEEAFYFAAEAKAILAVRPQLRSIDSRALGEFISCGCVLEDRTLFPGIRVLPPGSSWLFRNAASVRKGHYFNPEEWENQGSLDPESYYQELRRVFSANLPRYLNGPERVGISLTGGLDTRMIMAWANLPAQSMPSYTFGGPIRECHDVRVARKVAAVCAQPYQVLGLGDDFLSRFPHYAERTVYLSDGCAAVSRAPDLYLNEIAAQIAPVRLTGNYGSEILRRLRAFKPLVPPSDLYQPEIASHLGAIRQTYDALLQGHAVTFTAFRQAPWYQYGLLSLEQTQLAVRSPFLDNDVVRTAFRAPNAGIVKTDLFEGSEETTRLIADGSPALSHIPTDRGLGTKNGWRTAVSRGILEFTFRAEYAYDYGMPQWLAGIDHRLAWLHLERLFLGRHKFCHFRIWYRDSLARYVQEILLDPRSLSRPYLRRDTLESMVLHHTRGDRNYTTEITRLLTLELQHRLFVDAR